MTEEIKGYLAQCGLENIKLGHTYLADRIYIPNYPFKMEINNPNKMDTGFLCFSLLLNYLLLIKNLKSAPPKVKSWLRH